LDVALMFTGNEWPRQQTWTMLGLSLAFVAGAVVQFRRRDF